VPINNFTVTIPTPAARVRLSTALSDAKSWQEGGAYDIAYIFLNFELSSGTKVFIGDENVSTVKFAGSCTTALTFEPHGGAMRLGDLYAIGTAGDVLQIGAVPL
jgi:hypothetical protein